MTRQINPFGLRMPPELKEAIQASADKSRRSLNAEVVLRLQRSLEMEPLIMADLTPGELIREPSAKYESLLSLLIDRIKSLPPKKQRALLELLEK